MEYRSTTTVFCKSNIKAAVIYSDYVIPWFIYELWPSKEMNADGFLKNCKHILPPSIRENEELLLECLRNSEPFLMVPSARTLDEDGEDRIIDESDYYLSYAKLLRSVREPIDSIIGFQNPKEDIRENASIVCTLANLDLIDISKLTLEKVGEFRKDEESKRKLIEFRKAIYTVYQEKDRDFIHDDLQEKIQNYKKVASTWGFETIPSVLQQVFSLNSIPGLITALVGNISDVSALYSIGAALEIGSIGLTIRDARIKRNQMLKDLNVDYLINLQEYAENK